MMKTFILLPLLLLGCVGGLSANFNDTLTTGEMVARISIKKLTNGQTNVRDNGAFKIKKIVLDAGHGGKDSGCLGSGSKEKEIALSVTLKLGALIKEQFPDVEVIYTRSTDVFIPLHERTAIANKNKADLFVSIHCNYIVGASHVKGSETYVMGMHVTEQNLEVAKRENEVIKMEENYEQNYDLDPNSPAGHIMVSAIQSAYHHQSILFAEKVEKRIASHSGHHSRGVKQAGFFVLRNTAMPSVLIETGYLSNRNDEAFLVSEKGQNEISNAILLAFREYKERIELGTTSPDSAQVVAQPAAAEKQVLAAKAPITAAPQTTPKAIRTVQFRVQLAASKTQLNIIDTKWQSVGYPLEVIQEDGMYKYQAINFDQYQTAVQAQKILNQTGFTGSFVVAYIDGKKVPVAEAIEATKK